MTHGRVKIKTIIANVIRDTRLTDVSSVMDSMIEWAYEAETLIGSYDTFIRKECEIEVKNYRARLPHDFYQLIGFKVNNVYPQVTNRDFRLFYQESDNLAVANVNDTNTKMSLDNGYIHVTGIKDSVKGGLAYLAFDLDEDGFPLVKEGHEKAVTAYILWKLKTADWMNGYVSQSVYDRLEQRWYWLCGQARGDDEMPDPKQLEYIAALYQQLLPLPNKNFF